MPVGEAPAVGAPVDEAPVGYAPVAAGPNGSRMEAASSTTRAARNAQSTPGVGCAGREACAPADWQERPAGSGGALLGIVVE